MQQVRFFIANFIGKCASLFIRLFQFGSGGTWTGEIVLFFNPKALEQEVAQVTEAIILIAGTNGKTTTAAQIKNCLVKKGKDIVHNASGANLENGILSAFINQESLVKRKSFPYAILECDENTLPQIIPKLYKSKLNKTKFIVVFLNLFRDQLDRYGETDAIARKWKESLKILRRDAKLILNADDPQIAALGVRKNQKKPQKHLGWWRSNDFDSSRRRHSLWRRTAEGKESPQTIYFGLSNPSWYTELEHATDSTLCPDCGSKLTYQGVYFSHLGVWQCRSCGLKRPPLDLKNWNSPVPGLYNRYNTMAAAGGLSACGFTENEIITSLKNFLPAFGRQEELKIGNNKVKIFLSKNPVGFNESLKTVIKLGAKHLLLVLNDRIPDGRDVSCIWDVDFEMIPKDVQIIVSGDRVYDMGLRIKYSMKQWNNESMRQLSVMGNLKGAINSGLEKTNQGETLYILPTYSAMLEVRKVLKGRKIL